MPIVDSSQVASEPKGEPRNMRTLVFGCAILFAFVTAVFTMAVKDGMSGAVVTVLLAFALAATAVGVWGTAMAVKETEELGSRYDD